jgi:drug/metabolite transporter (DMT)-like permease
MSPSDHVPRDKSSTRDKDRDDRSAVDPRMIAILGGLGAALAWAVGTLCSARSSRLIGAASALAWVMLVGLLANLVMVGLGPGLGPLSGADAALLVAAGVGNVVGLFLAYTALRTGKVGLVAPIVSTEGAIAAVLAVVTGESLGAVPIMLLALMASGVVLAAVAPEEHAATGARGSAPVVLAALAALSFGIGLFATGRLGTTLPLGWVLLPPRVIGVVAVAIPLASTRRLRLTRTAAPLVVVAGFAEVLGFASYVTGARHGIAVAAVLASQFAAVASVTAYVLFRERLTRLQLGGVAVILVAIAALTAIKAG